MEDITKNPYLEMGKLLKSWRQNQFSASAVKLCDTAGFSFPYRVYSAFERGEQLPSTDTLFEIASYYWKETTELNKNMGIALKTWTWAQLSNSLKNRLKLQSIENLPSLLAQLTPTYDAEETTETEIDSNSIPPAEFDNTWVYSASERNLFVKNPWLLDILVRMAATFPDELSFVELGIDKWLASDAQKTLLAQIQTWVKEERMVESKTGIRLTLPHIHIPKTEAWDDLRKHIVQTGVEVLLPQITPESVKKKNSHRTNYTRVLTEEQKKDWVKKLAKMEMDYAHTPYLGKKDPTPKKPYMMLVLFASREMKLPRKK